MSTLSDAWYAFLQASLGQTIGSVSDLQNQFAAKYAGGLDSYMGGLLGRRFRSGIYYTYDETTTDNTFLMAQDQFYAGAFTVGAKTTFNQISLEVTTAGAGSTVDVAVYDSAADGSMRNQLVTANLSGAAIAVATAAISLTLQPGLYWLGSVAHTATPPTVRAKTAPVSRWLGQTSGGTATNTNYTQTGVTGPPAASNPAVVFGSSGLLPKVMLRAA